MRDAVFEELGWDEQQELKEAVCDAVLERTRRVVSGEGPHGAAILGEKPSKVLSSGFILPKLNEDGDDESSDIRIASHGLDIRLRSIDSGTITIKPSFWVYVRALPTSAELFARNGRLIPKADFNQDTRSKINAEIRRRSESEIPKGTKSRERAQLRAAISREVYRSIGVIVPDDTTLAAGDDRAAETIEDGVPPPPVINGGRLRIPDRLSRQYEIPVKWLRVDVDAPVLKLSLPCRPSEWEAASADYRRQLEASIRGACQTWLASDVGKANAWRKKRPPSEAFWGAAKWDEFLANLRATAPVASDLIPEFKVQILVQALPDPLEEGTFSVRLALENLQERDEDKEHGLFGVSLVANIPTASLRPMRLERVRRSYHLSGFMTMPAIGVNGGVTDLSIKDHVRVLKTSWMPKYVLPRIQAVSIPSVPTTYSALASSSTDVADLLRLSKSMEEWLERIRTDIRLSEAGEEGSDSDEAAQRARFDDDLAAWGRERIRIEKGIRLLLKSRNEWKRDPSSNKAIPYRAWLLLNTAFADATPPRKENSKPGWRLFQMAFVLSHLPTLASRLPEYADEFDAEYDEDSVSLLYMSTGGGKTEAFFGTLVYALFIDRLRGKHRGVTAMMHYPLRLLTVQQAQRLAKLLAQAELVRRRERIDGAPFEIGFWVGSSNTPNRTERKPGEVEDALRCIPTWNHKRAADETLLEASEQPEDRNYVIAKESWNKLPECPFCRSRLGTGLRLFPERRNQLGIVCFNQACAWVAAHPRGEGIAPEPLPFFVVDTDIYRRAPSVLLGTIDKLALLGQSIETVDRIAGMFGMARAIEGGPNGLLQMLNGALADSPEQQQLARVAPSYQDGTEVFHDPFPSLIVQDEMHLLEESLGTFGGIFETGLFAWLSRLAPLLGQRACRIPGAPDRPRLPHVIGATATAADVARHVRSLYQRRVTQFPHPGPSLHEGFYTRVARFEDGGEAAAARDGNVGSARQRESAAPWGRVYASLMTNGRLHTVTTLSILAAHAATITRWQRDLASGDPIRLQRVCGELEQNTSDAIWAERRRDALRRATAESKYELLANLIDLHRIELSYVTNKKGGDQILSALMGEVREAHAAMGPEYELDEYRMELISGGVDIRGIQAVVKAAERQFDPMRDQISQSLRGIVATSAISHGVDVEIFNAMAFAGMPPDIAEYIQASSRVGRTHVGFSLLIPTPQTRRDRFVVEVHESFHRLLERMIAPPAAERWADRAIQRTIPSLVQMWLGGVQHQQQFCRAARKGQMTLPTTVEQAERIFRDKALFDDCVRFVVEAVGVSAGTGAPANPSYYSGLVRAYADQVRSVILSNEFVGRLADFWRNSYSNFQQPMTSLRDVDVAGRIRGSTRVQKNQTISAECVATAMSIIRNRGISLSRRSPNSELDQES